MKILKSIYSSLHHKVLAAFLIVAILPYMLIILYFTYFGRSMIMKQEMQTHLLQAQQTQILIKNRLFQLKQEVLFLSKLEFFDDMISDDIDHRISRVLEQKSLGLKKESVTFLALNTKGVVVASSNAQLLGKKDLVKFDTSKKCGTKLVGKNLLIFSRIKASFEDRFLGYLIAVYPLENLKAYVVHNEGVNFLIKNDKNILVSSSDLSGSLTQRSIKIPLQDALKGYELIYSISDKQIFSLINRFVFYLTMLLFAGIAMIFMFSRRLTKQIVTPVTTLTDTAKKIINTKKYDIFVQSTTVDETNELAKAFNLLVDKTAKTLFELDRQRTLHMKRFVNLTDMVNQITCINNKNELLQVCVKKLIDIVPYDLKFVATGEKMDKKSICLPIKVYNFSSNTGTLYGYLSVSKEKFDDPLESRFFDSVILMISLQIERIDLVERIKFASNAKTSFISNMSHEFRTPLNAIIGFSQYLITYESMSTDQLETVSKIEKSAIYLLEMINNILDIAKIEAGKTEIDYSQVNIISILEECVELMTPMAEEKNLLIKGLENKKADIIIKTDQKLIMQVIINLLSNAIKFTQKGTIDIDVKKADQKITIQIKDTGIGIAKNELTKIFGEFVQLPNENQIKHRGTGLGLSLSLRIMQALGGELLIESNGIGCGTTAIISVS